MPKKTNPEGSMDDDMPNEIDFSGGVRGKYAVRFPEGSRVILLDADVAEVFPTQEAVNEALRDLAVIINRASKPLKPKKALKPKTKAAVTANVVK